MEKVNFKNGSIIIAGNIYFPPGFDERKKYAALIVTTPGSSVKEQIGANYCARMAEKGYVALTFDPSYQGESEGFPRDLEDPAARVEDIRCAIDFLMTLPYIDEDRVGILGICAGGGYAVNAAMTEHRIRAVGTVVASNIGKAFRQMGGSADHIAKTLEAVGRQRTIEARGGKQRRDQWIPDTPEEAAAAGITDPDTLEVVDYYRTPRGFHPNSTNRRLFRGDALLLGFDAFHLVGELLTQPIQIIVGGRLGTTFSYADGLQLFEQANSKKEFFVVEGAGHYDMYDKPEYIDQAVKKLETFYREYLRPF